MEMFLKFFIQTGISFFCVIECIKIFESNIFDPDIWKLDINFYI